MKQCITNGKKFEILKQKRVDIFSVANKRQGTLSWKKRKLLYMLLWVLAQHISWEYIAAYLSWFVCNKLRGTTYCTVTINMLFLRHKLFGIIQFHFYTLLHNVGLNTVFFYSTAIKQKEQIICQTIMAL